MEPSTGKKGKINGIFSTTKGQFRGGNTTNFATLLKTSLDGFLQTFKQVSKAVTYDKRPKVKRDAPLQAGFFPRIIKKATF